MVRAKGGFETLAEGGLILGILPASVPGGAVTLNPGDILVLFSDGVTEAVDPRRSGFRRGAAGRLWCGAFAIGPPPKLSRRSTTRCTTSPQGAPQFDDITVVVARRL